MNKKGVNLLEVIIAFVIAIILVVLIFRLIGVILPFGEKEDTTINFFSNLVDDINNLKDKENVSSLFTISEEYALVGFKKDLDYIGSGSYVSCGDFRIKQINKPDDFKDKGALCLCDRKLLDKDADACKSEDAICVGFDYDIINSKNNCEIFVLFGKSTNNLRIERKGDVIDIHKS